MFSYCDSPLINNKELSVAGQTRDVKYINICMKNVIILR